MQKWSEKYWDLSNPNPYCCTLALWKHNLSARTELSETFHLVSRYPKRISCSNAGQADRHVVMQHFDALCHVSRWPFVWEANQAIPVLKAADVQLQKSTTLPSKNWSVKRKFTSLPLFRVSVVLKWQKCTYFTISGMSRHIFSSLSIPGESKKRRGQVATFPHYFPTFCYREHVL